MILEDEEDQDKYACRDYTKNGNLYLSGRPRPFEKNLQYV